MSNFEEAWDPADWLMRWLQRNVSDALRPGHLSGLRPSPFGFKLGEAMTGARVDCEVTLRPHAACGVCVSSVWRRFPLRRHRTLVRDARHLHSVAVSLR